MSESIKSCVACKVPLTYVGVRSLRTGGGEGMATFLHETSESVLRLAI